MTTDKGHIARTMTVTVDEIGTFEVPLGLNLREALRREGVYLDGTCSDNGTCGRCVVRVIEGDAGQPSTQERGLLGEKAVSEGKRLSCRIKVCGDLRVLVDPEHLLELDRTGKWKEVWDSPLWRPDLFKADRSGYGIAVDIGTSSVVSSLLDLSLGRPMDLKTAANPQMPWGEDIISRLDKAAADPVTADRLRRLIWETIARQVRSLCLRNGISGGRIGQVVIVGNSAMHHLAVGAPARELILPPYSPADRSAMTLSPGDLPVDPGLSGRCDIYFAPLIGGYAGSDALASVLAAGCGSSGRGALLDVGTNTEIAVWDAGKVLVATAPSGPAFEGGHIRSGMRAEEGAVWKVEIEGGKVLCQVVGGGEARGICGTGMVDALAAMLDAGILDRTGLLNAGSHPHIRDNTFFLSSDNSVALTGGDIATLQKAQSAVSTVFRLLLKSIGLKANSLEKVFIAGAFGSRLNVVNAMATGLLPTLPAESYVLAGNTALVGASMMLVSKKLRQNARDLAGSIVHCDLTSDPEFEETFIDGLYFPVK